MDKIPVLIISAFFAPQTHAAMFRVHKLVKYLPKYGYKPIVVTTDINYNYNENLNLLKEFTSDVEIYKTQYIEPTFRGLKMFFGGEDTTFKTMKAKGLIKIQSSSNIALNKEKLINKYINHLKKIIYNRPDAYWTWVYSASRLANKLIKEKKIKLFYTVANPNTILKIGLNIKNKNPDIKWVADFRDPIGYSYKFENLTQKEIFWIKNTFEKADVIVGLSNSYGGIFKKLYDLKEEKFQFIPTGVDEEYIPKEQLSKENYVVFAGEYQVGYDTYLFELLSELKQKKILKENFRIKIIGRKEINEPLIKSKLNNKNRVLEMIEFIDNISQKELYKIIKKSKAGILFVGEYFWWNNFAKLVDYIGLNTKVITFASQNSEAYTELKKANLGVFLTGDINKDLDILKIFFEKKDIENATDYYKKYLANSQVKLFVEIFNKLLKVKNAK